jgi:hypothetical protein
VQRLPEAGERLPVNGAIQLTFDRPMDQASVAGALKLQPAIKGNITWTSPRSMSFTPAEALPRDSVIDIALTQDAKGQDGAALTPPMLFRVQTQGNLEVAGTIPADGAGEIAPDTIITVLFNRPVVPLTTLAQQESLPNPLTIDPPLEGKAEWLNTSVLVFRPTRALAGGTRYTGRIAADFKDIDGNPLAAGYSWTFSTVAPKVIEISPGEIARSGQRSARRNSPYRQDGRTLAPVDTAIVVRFNQPVDAASAQAAFSLSGPGNTALSGVFSVLSDTLTFTPSQQLEFNSDYAVRIAPGVVGASGGVPGTEEINARFTTVPLPEIVSIEPVDGDVRANPYTPVRIRFNTRINPETVLQRLTMTPALSPTQVTTYYQEYDNTFTLFFDAQPGSSYVLEIAPGIEDPYGNRIAGERSVRFRTRDLDPFAYLMLPYTGATLNANTLSRIVAHTTNITRLEIELYKLEESGEELSRRYYRLEDSLGSAKLLRKFVQPVNAPRNKRSRTLVDLGAGKPLPAGAYLLRMFVPEMPADQQRYRPLALLVISDMNLVLKSERSQVLVWATDLKSGAPVADIPIEAFEIDQSRQNAPARSLGQATTDATGVARIERNVDIGAWQNGVQPVFAVARGARFALIQSDWNGGIAPYDFNLQLPYSGSESPVRGHVYTDRPLYRAGQTVHLRGILRNQDDFSYSVPTALNTSVVVRDAVGNTLVERPVALDGTGSFAIAFDLPAGAPLGDYFVEIRVSGENNLALGNIYGNFTVAAYRPPEFEVTVTPLLSETVRGGNIDATINTRYLSGGALGGAKVRWNVLASHTTFAPAGFERYSFDDSDNPWRCYFCWWQRGDDTPPQPLLSGEGVSDASGQLRISVPVPAELRDSRGELISGPVLLSIEAVATGSDDQVLAGRASVTAHPADFYVGVAFDQYVVDAGKPVTAALVAVDWAGARVSGTPIEASLIRREWSSRYVPASEGIGGRWESEVKDEIISTVTLSSDARGEAMFGFTAPKAGTYKIVVSSGPARASRFVWVTGPDYVSWYRENNDRINLIANKTSYAQGETAEILIPTPFVDAKSPEHYALITVERGHIRKHDVVRVDSSSFVYRLPIADDYAPNVFVSVVLISGQGAARPEQKLGLLMLPVTPRKQTLSVTLTPDRKLTQPGETVQYMLDVKDAEGKPVRGAFSIDLVDKGVLNLKPRGANAIVEAFYGVAGLSVNTASALSVSADRISEEAERQQQVANLGAADSTAFESAAGEAPKPTEAPAPAAVARAKVDQDASAGQAVAVRENFADTAFWKADVQTDANGQATLQIRLPDNLTTWVIRAVGIDAETRVGEGLGDVVATKPLLIRPVTPRFLVVGDVIELSAVINNNTEQAVNATVQLQASGVVLEGDGAQTMDIPAGGERVVRWTGKTTDAPQADLVFLVKSADGAYSDASKPRLSTAPNGGLKINRYSAPETIGTAGELGGGAATRSEVVAIPPGLDQTQGELTVRMDASLAASMQDGLRYVESWEYDCTEQTVSKFLPNVLTYRALQRLNIENAELKAKLPDMVRINVERLYTLQNNDGGWGWWRGEVSNPNTSAYAVFGLLKAKEAGFEINADALNRGLVYLQTQRQAMTVQSSAQSLDWQVWLAYVLGEAGQGDDASVSRLYELRGKLSHYGRALMILTLGKRDAQDARIKTLFADLNAKVIQSATGAHWEESATDWWAMNSDTRSTALVLSAYANYGATNPLVPNIVRWLMMARRVGTGYWRSTYETSWALIGLTDWLAASGELAADYGYGVQFNGVALTEARASRATITQTNVITIAARDLLADAGNRLTFAKDSGPGKLYYSAHLKAYLPVPSIKAADRGIVIQRRYVKADCTDGVKCPAISEAKVGDVLRVELTLIAPRAVHYLQLEDPLPAGAEAIDTSLATASQLDAGPSLSRSSDEGISRRWWWYWGWWSRSEMRDDKVALFATYLSAGTYTYSYTMRITSAGVFNVIPSYAAMQYLPEVFGRSDGAQLTVTR